MIKRKFGPSIKLGLLTAFFLTLIICFFPRSEKKPIHSFISWSSSFGYWGKEEQAIFDSLEVEHMYVRFFDIDWDEAYGGPVPMGEVSLAHMGKIETLPDFTPSFYFRNKVFERIDSLGIISLADKFEKKAKSEISNFVQTTKRYFQKNDAPIADTAASSESNLSMNPKKKRNKPKLPPGYPASENCHSLLLDCDWTVKSKDKFFAFVEEIKKRFVNWEINVTLRLWQFRDQKLAGIPPADRCLLMCYNVAGPDRFSKNISIGSNESIEPYIVNSSYPLPIDVALPVFSWAAIYRGQNFKGLLSLDEEESLSENKMFDSISPGMYHLKADTVMGNFYARVGDVVKFEEISKKELNNISALVMENIDLDETCRISFFSWNEERIRRYGVNNLERIYENNF